jgi:hypothetical protein
MPTPPSTQPSLLGGSGDAHRGHYAFITLRHENFDRACGETQFSGSIFGARAQSHELELSRHIQTLPWILYPWQRPRPAQTSSERPHLTSPKPTHLKTRHAKMALVRSIVAKNKRVVL